MAKETEDKTEIKKIVLQVEGKEVILTVEGAKKLKSLLNNLFGNDIIKEIKIIERDHYHPVPYNPWKWDYIKPNWICDTGSVKYVADKHQVMCCVDSGK